MTELNYTPKTWDAGDYIKAKEVTDMSLAVGDTEKLSTETNSFVDSFKKLFGKSDTVVCANHLEGNVTNKGLVAVQSKADKIDITMHGKVKKHNNANQTQGYWIGFGLIPNDEYKNVKKIHFNQDFNTPLVVKEQDSENSGEKYAKIELDKQIWNNKDGLLCWVDAYPSDGNNRRENLKLQYQWLGDNDTPVSPILFLELSVEGVEKDTSNSVSTNEIQS